MRRAVGREVGEQQPDHLGPNHLGEGFRFYSRYIWQPLESFKRYTLLNFFGKDNLAALWSGF